MINEGWMFDDEISGNGISVNVMFCTVRCAPIESFLSIREAREEGTWLVKYRIRQERKREKERRREHKRRQVCVLHSGLESSRRVNWLNYLG